SKEVTWGGVGNGKVGGVGIGVHYLLNLQCKAVHAATHIGRARCQPDTNTRWRNNHRRSTLITRRSVTRPTSCPTSTDVPSGSVISILPPDTCSAPDPAGGATCFVSLPWAASPIVRTGRNIGGGSGPSHPKAPWLPPGPS